jgi:alkanesulfonate monooxygenase SsuD/methylene tetrahydromethanopterin reductase-like flavin-dependent oxidoreductase (luciferase family)
VTTAADPLRFGYFLVPAADSPLIATAQRIERFGLDYVGIQDHPYHRGFADTWAVMAMIAASTTTLRIFPDVANLPLRPPAVMAKAAATIDLLSGGRFELGLGAGGFWDAIEAYGGPRRSPREALDALDEAMTSQSRGLWRFDMRPPYPRSLPPNVPARPATGIREPAELNAPVRGE